VTELSKTLVGEPAMLAFGAQLVAACPRGAVIYLSGDLGMGKTTLCRGVLQSLGHTGPVKSPTYTLVEPYSLPSIIAYHFDLYRLSDPEELEYMGIRDYFLEGGLCLVEWPEKGAGILPLADIEVRIEAIDHGRTLTVQGQSRKGQAIIDCLQNKPGSPGGQEL
jgi:tRNA threonylcarbamoyladenosine biosynthesis protein TsaE